MSGKELIQHWQNTDKYWPNIDADTEFFSFYSMFKTELSLDSATSKHIRTDDSPE